MIIKIAKAIIAVQLILIVFFTVISIRPFTKLGSSDFNRRQTSFVINPLINRAQVEPFVLQDPYVSVAPGSWRYYIALMKQESDLKNGTFDRLFFAAKRINELSKWQSHLKILNSVNSSKTLSQWWRQTSHKQYDSWESLLAMYQETMQQEIDAAKSKPLPEMIKESFIINFYLTSHENTLYQLIGTKNNVQKTYLSQIVKNMFGKFRSEVSIDFNLLSEKKIMYDVSEILSNKEFGSYELVLDTKNIPDSYRHEASLIVNNPSGDKEITQMSNDQFPIYSFKDVEIDKDTSQLTVALSQIQLVTNKPWDVIYDTKTNQYTYTKKIENFNTEQPYLFVVQNNTSRDIYILITKQYLTTNKSHPPLYEILNMGVDKNITNTVFRHIEFPYGLKGGFATMKVTSPQPLEESQLKLAIVPLFDAPIYAYKAASVDNFEPSIKYEETSFYSKKIIAANTSHSQDALITQSLPLGWRVSAKHILSSNIYELTVVNKFVLYVAYLIGSMLLIMLLLILLNKKPNNFSTTVMLAQQVLKRIRKYIAIKTMKIFYARPFVNFEIFILTFGIGLIALHIFLINHDFDFLVIPFFFLWIFIIGSSAIDAELLKMLGLLLFGLTPVLFALKLEDAGEKNIIWAYFFILTGILIEIIEVLGRQKRKYGKDLLARDFLKYKITRTVFHLAQVAFLKVLSITLFALQLILKTLINNYHVSRREFTLYVAKLKHATSSPTIFITTLAQLCFFIAKKIAIVLCLFIVFGGIIYAGIFTYQKYIGYTMYLQKKALEPYITHFEPKVVYRGTKVVLKGKSLGWNIDGQSRVVSSQGIVPTDLWTNEKIIITMPLTYAAGTVTLSVEKPFTWHEKKTVGKSNAVTIKLLPVGTTWTKEDQEYQDQLKLLDKETLKLNGY